MTKLFVLVLPEEPELRRVTRGLWQAKVLEGKPGEQPAARCALQEALLDQERFDDVLDGVARF